MITIQFSLQPNQKQLFQSYADVLPMQEAIIEKMKFELGFARLAKRIVVQVDEVGLEFYFCLEGVAAGNDENGRIIVRAVNTILCNLGIKKFFLLGFMTQSELNDQIPVLDFLVGPEAINSKLLKKYGISNAPKQYCCSILLCVMDDPVYIRGGKNRYDRRSLIKWNSAQTKLLDPVKGTYFEEDDIISDGPLKAEINQYVAEAISNALLAKANTRQTTSAKNEQPPLAANLKQENEKALRNHAANGRVEELQALIDKKVNVDAIDSNPAQGKTALHWAVIKGHANCVEKLLAARAKIDLPDARSRKTVKQYAEEGNSEDIKAIFRRQEQINLINESRGMVLDEKDGPKP